MRENRHELIAVEHFLNELTANLSLVAGSIFRIPRQALHSWGINVTDENRDWIREKSEKSFDEEWSIGSILNDAVNEAATRVHLGEGNHSLNSRLAEAAVDILQEIAALKPDEEIVIGDVGAGAGDTHQAILSAIEATDNRDLGSRCRFVLIEPSEDAIHSAAKKARIAERLYTVNRAQWKTVGGGDSALLDDRDGLYDMLVSNAVLHHKSFPDYLAQFARVLKDDGALVIGDWYTTMWYHPATVLDLLEALGADDNQRSAYKDYFRLDEENITRVFDALTSKEKAIHQKMIGYLKRLGTILARKNLERERDAKKANRPTPEKIIGYFLEAHESEKDRQGKMQEHGFETDLGTLKETRPIFRKVRTSPISCLAKYPTLARVMVAGKAVRAAR